MAGDPPQRLITPDRPAAIGDDAIGIERDHTAAVGLLGRCSFTPRQVDTEIAHRRTFAEKVVAQSAPRSLQHKDNESGSPIRCRAIAGCWRPTSVWGARFAASASL
jgi:hypothetical protein